MHAHTHMRTHARAYAHAHAARVTRTHAHAHTQLAVRRRTHARTHAHTHRNSSPDSCMLRLAGLLMNLPLTMPIEPTTEVWKGASLAPAGSWPDLLGLGRAQHACILSSADA